MKNQVTYKPQLKAIQKAITMYKEKYLTEEEFSRLKQIILFSNSSSSDEITNEKKVISRKKITPESKEELKRLIIETIIKEGPHCNLNFIDTSRIVDMSYLFSVADPAKIAGVNVAVLRKFMGK